MSGAVHSSRARYYHRLSGRGLFRLIIVVSALCISYEGMSQGIMGKPQGIQSYSLWLTDQER